MIKVGYDETWLSIREGWGGRKLVSFRDGNRITDSFWLEQMETLNTDEYNRCRRLTFSDILYVQGEDEEFWVHPDCLAAQLVSYDRTAE